MEHTENNESDRQSNIEIMPTGALEAITRGEIDIQISTAHKYPRSIDLFKKRAIAMATIDRDTAESCLYSRPVGKGPDGKQKIVEGMSVRMAEIVGACYGNLRVAAMIIEQTPEQVKTRGMAHDLETNFASSADIVESTLDSNNKPYSPRMRVTAAKAAVAKARRDATFQVVPRALARPIEAAVRALLLDDKAQTFSQRRDGMVKWIETKGIDPARVWAILEVKGPDDLQAEHFITMTGLRTAIKEGDISLDEAFPFLHPVKRAPKPQEERTAKETPVEQVASGKEPGQEPGEVIAMNPAQESTGATPGGPTKEVAIGDEEKEMLYHDELMGKIRADQQENGWSDGELIDVLKNGYGFPKHSAAVKELDDCTNKFLEMVVKALLPLNKAIEKNRAKK